MKCNCEFLQRFSIANYTNDVAEVYAEIRKNSPRARVLYGGLEKIAYFRQPQLMSRD